MAKRGKPSRDPGRWLASTATPVFIVDTQRRIAAFNKGCEDLTGWPADDVIGETCHFTSLPETTSVHALAACLCPPPDTFEGREATVPVGIVCREGPTLPRRIVFVPLRENQGGIAGILGIVIDAAPAIAAQSGDDRKAALHAELADLRARMSVRFGPQTLVTRAQIMSRTLAQVELAQRCDASVLITGETGVGREHLARCIHFGSPRKHEWFVPLDCRRMSPDELARVWRRLNAQSGGSASNPAMEPGSLFLADVEFLPRDLQADIATAYADDMTRPAIRLLASASQPLHKLRETAPLKPEFLSLVSTLAIDVPPLRDRPEDVPLLAVHFLEDANRQGERQLAGFADEVWPLFARYHWPKNLDELGGVVREAHARSQENQLRPSDLPFRFRDALNARDLPPKTRLIPIPMADLLDRVEKRLMTLALERASYNKTEAAENLGISRPRLYRRMEQLGIADHDPGGKVPDDEWDEEEE